MSSLGCQKQPDGSFKDLLGYGYTDSACTQKQCLLQSNGMLYGWGTRSFTDSRCTCEPLNDGKFVKFVADVDNVIYMDNICSIMAPRQAVILTPSTTTATTTQSATPSNDVTTTTTVAPSGTIITTRAPTSSAAPSTTTTTMRPTTTTTTTTTRKPSVAPVVVPVTATDVADDTTVGNPSAYGTVGNATTDTSGTTVAPSFLGMTDNQRLALYVVLGLIALIVLFMVVRRIFASKNVGTVPIAAAAVPVSSVAVPLAESAATTA